MTKQVRLNHIKDNKISGVAGQSMAKFTNEIVSTSKLLSVQLAFSVDPRVRRPLDVTMAHKCLSLGIRTFGSSLMNNDTFHFIKAGFDAGFVVFLQTHGQTIQLHV